jgi:hypothetical protein
MFMGLARKASKPVPSVVQIGDGRNSTSQKCLCDRIAFAFWYDPGDLNRCIFRSRRRTGRCEFSARLFLRKPCSWRAVNLSSDFVGIRT